MARSLGEAPQFLGDNHVATMTTDSFAPVHRFLTIEEEVETSNEHEIVSMFKDAELLLVRKFDQMIVAISTGSDYDKLYSEFREQPGNAEVKESGYRFVPGPAKLLQLARLMAEDQDRVKSTERR